MKTYLWTFAALLCLAGCSSSDEPQIEKPVTEDDFESPDGRVVIQLGAKGADPTADIMTRTPLSNTKFETGGTTLGVFMAANTGSWTATEVLRLANRKAEVTNQERTAADGADVQTSSAVTAPHKITLYDAEGITPGKVEYYPMVSDKDFTFYAYSPYVASQSVAAGDATVTFSGFNGSQDILWAKAEAPMIPSGAIWEDTGEETTADLTGYNAKYVRKLKYHYELNQTGTPTKQNYPWVPNLVFSHQLVQLQFFVEPAQKQSFADKIKAGKLFVSNIRIAEHGKPSMSVKSGTLTFTGADNLTAFAVTGGSTFTDNTLTSSVHPTADVMVGYLLVKPNQATYKLLVDIAPFKAADDTEDTDNKQTDIPVTLQLENGNFQAGYSYKIKLGIYAMQEIEADASLTEWQSGEDVKVDIE